MSKPASPVLNVPLYVACASVSFFCCVISNWPCMHRDNKNTLNSRRSVLGGIVPLKVGWNRADIQASCMLLFAMISLSVDDFEIREQRTSHIAHRISLALKRNMIGSGVSI